MFNAKLIIFNTNSDTDNAGGGREDRGGGGERQGLGDGGRDALGVGDAAAARADVRDLVVDHDGAEGLRLGQQLPAELDRCARERILMFRPEEEKVGTQRQQKVRQEINSALADKGEAGAGKTGVYTGVLLWFFGSAPG